MRILVAGGAGFIGSHLCEALLARGETVIAIDNYLTGRPRNLATLVGHERFHLLEQDITQPLDVAVDQIYHLASPASPVGYSAHPIETHVVNSVGTHRLLDLARANDAAFLLTSTSEAYGDPLEHPQRETYFGNVNPIGPRSCYDESKRFAESLTMEYVRQYGHNARIVRLFNTYGPRMDPVDGRVVPNFINQALQHQPLTIYGDGSQTRSFCYVSDIVRGLLAAMDTDGTAGEVFNLGNPDEWTIVDFARHILAALDRDLPIEFLPGRQDDPTRRCPDITKARTRLRWQPVVTLADGLPPTIESFRLELPIEETDGARRR
ncbi:MAG: SDR family oxidoreductase [Chloroflexi bacterium]|nr:SDR family oxidoreductase [Chloroflexota bacterium]